MKKFFWAVVVVLIATVAFVAAGPFYCFATCYGVEVVSAEPGRMIGGTWKPNTYFYHNEEMSVKVTAKNNEGVEKTATIYVNTFDYLNQPLGLYIKNVTFAAGETKIIYAPLYIPKWAISGVGRVTATAKTLPEGTFCPQKTGNFYVRPGNACYLTVQTFTTDGAQIFGFGVWVDSDFCLSPATVPLAPNSHTVKAQARYGSFEESGYYIYDFDHWEDGSTSNSRMVNLPQNTNKTITAYCVKYRGRWQPL
jgi:hypothetical protein